MWMEEQALTYVVAMQEYGIVVMAYEIVQSVQASMVVSLINAWTWFVCDIVQVRS